MSDPVSAARAARENLARGLGALQSPGVPPQLLPVAEPIAHAMSALHKIEASHGAAVLEAGPAALNAVRQALATLQQSAGLHPAVDQALEAIASSLSLIHNLAQTVPPPAPAQAYAPPAGQWPQPQAAQPAPAYQQPAPAYQQPAPAYQQPAPAYQQPAPAYQQPAPAPAYQQPAPQAAAPLAHAPTAPPGALRLEAALGAHSTTNFYKGLSGNDVIDSGGIFIATYQIPEIGRQLSIKVSMPGGYEFEALAVVHWTRDATGGDSDTSPGFGAQFTQISPEGRQLVYRYVRNREPLFHDDL